METQRPKMRKDAAANRERLILAGKRLMQDQGGDVSVEIICEHAGITRGTFYRNFSDRAALYQAVLEHELGVMAEALDVETDDPLRFMRLYAEMMRVYDKFMSVLPDMQDMADDGVSEAKIIRAIDPSLARAKRQGVIAQHVTGDDIMLVCRMVAADWRLDRAANKDEALERRLGLVLTGISPRN